MEWVQIEGGSDDRLQALIAGQIDVAVLQPRHLLPLDEANGQMIYQEYKDVPQEVWVVKSDTMENNKDAVCAYLKGRIQAKQWASEGDDYTDNQDAAVAIGKKYDLEPTEGDLDEWQAEMEYNWALTGGAPLDAFEQWNDDMIANGNVPDGFDWKEHADFSCLTQVQEDLGLEVAARGALTHSLTDQHDWRRPLPHARAGASRVPGVRRRTGPGRRKASSAGAGLAFTEQAQDLKGPRALRRNAGGSSRRLLSSHLESETSTVTPARARPSRVDPPVSHRLSPGAHDRARRVGPGQRRSGPGRSSVLAPRSGWAKKQTTVSPSGLVATVACGTPVGTTTTSPGPTGCASSPSQVVPVPVRM